MRPCLNVLFSYRDIYLIWGYSSEGDKRTCNAILGLKYYFHRRVGLPLCTLQRPCLLKFTQARNTIDICTHLPNSGVKQWHLPKAQQNRGQGGIRTLLLSESIWVLGLASQRFSLASQRLLLSSSALTAVLGVCSANISTRKEDACLHIFPTGHQSLESGDIYFALQICKCLD